MVRGVSSVIIAVRVSVDGEREHTPCEVEDVLVPVPVSLILSFTVHHGAR